MAILHPSLPVPPPNALDVPKPEDILKQPSLSDRKKDLEVGINDVPFSDIDPGVFNRELVRLKIYARPDAKHLE